jgi:histidinol-phosphate aminotransferase
VKFEELVPPNIAHLHPYQPGKPVEELERELGVKNAIKLASNENPLGPSPKGMAAARAAIGDAHRYPDGGGFRLRGAIAKFRGVDPSQVMLGAGSNELIELLIRIFCRPNGEHEVLSHAHAFVMYKVSCEAAGVTYREAPCAPDLSCDVDALADAITPRTRIVFLPNPNNPTGLHIPRPAFERLLGRMPKDVIFVVDEAYYEYAHHAPDYPDGEAYRGQAGPLYVTLRTFSKAYGLAALRVGYGIADARLVDYVNRVRLPFNVPMPAQLGALAALDDSEHVERSRALNAAGMAQLGDGLKKLGLKVWPSLANFLLVECGGEAARMYDALLRKGVIVRPLGSYKLPRHLRISIGTPEENERALAAFAEVLAA